jgi:hypothetical protein
MSGRHNRSYIPWLAMILAALAALPAFGIDRVDLVNPDLEALARLPMINLPPPPAWKYVQQGASWTVDDISAEFAKITNHPPAINTVRSTFIRPDHQWIVAYTTWFSHLNKALKLAFKDQVWDCDNFTRSFVAFADILALRGGETRGSLCVGFAKVANREAFGEVYGSDMGSHALVVVGTSKGLFVIEPQSGKIAPLGDYPNRNEFQEINF